jgi:hypothetical protein
MMGGTMGRRRYFGSAGYFDLKDFERECRESDRRFRERERESERRAYEQRRADHKIEKVVKAFRDEIADVLDNEGPTGKKYPSVSLRDLAGRLLCRLSPDLAELIDKALPDPTDAAVNLRQALADFPDRFPKEEATREQEKEQLRKRLEESERERAQAEERTRAKREAKNERARAQRAAQKEAERLFRHWQDAFGPAPIRIALLVRAPCCWLPTFRACHEPNTGRGGSRAHPLPGRCRSVWTGRAAMTKPTPQLRMLAAPIAQFDARVKSQPKVAAAHYGTREHREWRAAILQRGQLSVRGLRPVGREGIELLDGGPALDVATRLRCGLVSRAQRLPSLPILIVACVGHRLLKSITLSAFGSVPICGLNGRTCAPCLGIIICSARREIKALPVPRRMSATQWERRWWLLRACALWDSGQERAAQRRPQREWGRIGARG